MTTQPTELARTLFARLETAWNAADGASFASPFTADADFVDIRGAHHTTRDAIGAGHQAIFDSIYRGSTVSYTVTDARSLAPGCVVMHATGTLEVPAGPMAGSHGATMTAVSVDGADGWSIAAFQNTLVAR